MVKSVLLDDTIHQLLLDKQTEMLKDKNVRISLSEIAGQAIKSGIGSVSENGKYRQLHLV